MTPIAFFLALIFAAGPVVHMPVPDPGLPSGWLSIAGATASGDVYFEMSSFKRSDIPGLVRGTVVVIQPENAAAPIQVVLTWIDCKRNVFQLSSGRTYDAMGVEGAPSPYVPDAPIPAGSPMSTLAKSFCAAPGSRVPMVYPGVTDWRAALARSVQSRSVQ